MGSESTKAILKAVQRGKYYTFTLKYERQERGIRIRVQVRRAFFSFVL